MGDGTIVPFNLSLRATPGTNNATANATLLFTTIEVTTRGGSPARGRDEKRTKGLRTLVQRRCGGLRRCRAGAAELPRLDRRARPIVGRHGACA
ncbi:MAG TPA: hypothetical protein VG755_35565 [Nannocystaceae bacterium]|nr:hypothetical protein [Nannocystaceae bacterium]